MLSSYLKSTKDPASRTWSILYSSDLIKMDVFERQNKHSSRPPTKNKFWIQTVLNPVHFLIKVDQQKVQTVSSNELWNLYLTMNHVLRCRKCLGIRTAWIGQFITVAVNLKNDSKRIFDIHHSIWFFIWEILADWHALLAARCNYFLKKPLDIRVLDCKMKGAVFSKFQILFRLFIALNSKSSNPILSAVARCAIRNFFQLAPKTSVHIWPISESSSTISVGGMMI